MPASPEVIAARKRATARYAIEDFDDEVRKTVKMGLLFVVLALMMGVSIWMGAANYQHLVFTVITGVALLSLLQLELLQRNTLLAVTVAAVGVIAMEFVTLGLPEVMFPQLVLMEPGRLRVGSVGPAMGTAFFLNLATPLIYFGAKCGVLLIVANLWRLRARVAAQPELMLRSVLPPDRLHALRAE